MASRNTSDEKPYGEVYARFKECVVVPVEVLERYYTSGPVRHCYGEEEIASFVQRWSRPRLDADAIVQRVH
jgi:hypothetical protein